MLAKPARSLLASRAPRSRRLAARIPLVLILVSTVAGAVWGQTVPKGDRILGIDVAPAEDGDYFAAFQRALDAGMESVSLSLDWSVLEPTPGNYLDPADPENILAIANQFFGSQVSGSGDLRVAISIRPINTLVSDLPADLEGLPFDHPTVIARFQAMLDHSLPQLEDLTLEALAIGAEVDIHLGEDATRWQQFSNFFVTVRDHLRGNPTVVARWPDLEIGSEVTYPGLIHPAIGPLARDLQSHGDSVLVSYYPLDGELAVRPPTVVHQDFDTLVGLFPGRTIRFIQLGYPSGYFSSQFYDLANLEPTIGSSEELQRRFIEEIFEAWDRHADTIREICFTWMNDLSQEQAEFFANEDPAFSLPGNDRLVEFLRTLGLRTHGPGSGVDKAAFQTLRSEARERGWPVVGGSEACVPSDEQLCLLDGRFAVRAQWTVPDSDPPQGDGQAFELTADTGAFWFFGPENLELMVKVIDGRGFNGRFWVFFGALSNVAFSLTVTDTESGAVAHYDNPAGTFASRGDTHAF